MEPWLVVVLAGVALTVVLALVGLFLKVRNQRKSTKRLQAQFGSEYGATVSEVGRKKGEKDLVTREQRVEGFHLQPLKAPEAERLGGLWTATQSRFVDDPGGAVSDADKLLGEAMQARGYPVADFEQRVSDISVNHPEFVVNYRAAHAGALKHSQGKASTEDLRQAMVHYRWLFSDVVGEPVQALAP